MSNLNDLFFQTHEHWMTEGPPKRTFPGAGPLFLAMGKKTKSDWAGGTINGGEVIGKLPVRTRRNGNIGPAYTRVAANAAGFGGSQFQVPLSEMWHILKIRSKFLEVLKNPGSLESGMSGLMDDMEQSVDAWATAMSYTLWGDGRGAVGCGDGAYTITGNVIQLLNFNSARCFEQGDVLRLVARATYDAAAPGTRPAARTGTVTVLSVNEDNGQITTVEANIQAAIPGAVNTDVISKDVYYAGVGDTDNTTNIGGIYTYLARTNTLASATVYGVNRSTRPDRLAGRRINLTGSESPGTIVAKILATADASGANIDMISVPSSEVEELITDLQSRNMLTREVTVGVDKPQNLTYGVTAMGAQYAQMKVAIVSDRYQIDHFVTASNDKSYVGLNMSDWHLDTTMDGINWRDWDGDGEFLQQIVGTQDLQAAYGTYAALACEDPGHQILAAVNTNV